MLSKSITARKVESSDFSAGTGRCAVRTYERYDSFGGSRLTLQITVFSCDGETYLSAISSGGSRAMFFKINTWGEDAFLGTVEEIIGRYRI